MDKWSELEKAWDKFILDLGHELKLDKFLDWLIRRIDDIKRRKA